MIESMFLEVADITVPFWLPPLVAFGISFFTSMVGVSGSFLLLPFQMSVLGYVSPSVSATNLVFNLVAIPGGIWHYARIKRMDWPLAWTIATGTLPGLLVGWWLRVHWLLDARTFKLFVGVILLGLAIRLLGNKSAFARGEIGVSISVNSGNTIPIFLVALIIGVIGGAYGIGGGSIMAPVLIAVFSLPVYEVAGAALLGTFVTSVVGVALYQFLPAPPGINTRPDWTLGILFGLGGVVGMYMGAQAQKHFSHRALELGISIVLVLVAGGYAVEYVLGSIH
ncbi:sulfite exporter TauE/SafE family protein [Methylomonas sp. LW13]|uniref:sulfite exporter TauE/SafE family protein n=2 Tax=unclassified Methylomonas TaxID=2608980 RepID=UPI000B1E6842|nr:sulfite exporter TauE/SafE family protein [Methylomonas sp. LW13]